MILRQLIIILLLLGHISAQSFVSRLSSPITYELGLEPGYQSNPLNLSELEITKAAADPDYLDGIEFSSSNVLSVYGKFNYAPRLFSGRKTRLSLTAFAHFYTDIQERSYQSISASIRQSIGNYRYVSLGYGLLPELYLRNYRYQDPATLISTREPCSFGSERLWLGYEHRLTKKNRLEYRITRRLEVYSAPFSAYDMAMLEGAVQLKSDQFSALPFTLELQYGISDNHNDLDAKDRSYRYLNIRPATTLTLPGKHRLRVSGRYDQRVYISEENNDPLHAGRYQDEIRLDLRLLPRLESDLVLEPFFGYRERRVDSSDPAVADLKSFTRYWFGVRVGLQSVIDMYF